MAKPVKKYSSWGKYLKTSRESRFASAREFWSQLGLQISYAQYSRYESGSQLPSLEEALRMGKSIGVSISEVSLEWIVSQLSDDQCAERAQLELEWRNASEAATRSAGTAQVPLDEVIVFNRAHLKLFSSDPAYRDVFTYINSFAPDSISARELSSALSIALPRVFEMLKKLYDLGVLVKSESGFRASKKNFYFPDDEDFFPLRNLNWKHNAEGILSRISQEDLQLKRASRLLVTRELTESQARLIIDRLEELMGELVNLPETSTPETIYSVCAIFGERFRRSPLI